MKKRASLATAIFAMMISVAKTAEILSFEDCVRLAGEHNGAILSAELSMQAIRLNEKVTRSAFLPKISADISRDRSGGSLSSTSDTYSAGLSGSLEIFSGLRDSARMQQAEARSASSETSVQETKAQISYELKNAFESLKYAKEYSKLTKEIIRRREENLRTVELRFQGGLENKGSVLLSKAYLEQARYDDLQAKNLEKISRAKLARVIGRDDRANFDIEGEVPVAEIPERNLDLGVLAMDVPELRRADYEEASAKAALTESRSGFFPKLSLSARTNEIGADFYPSERDSWSVGVGVTIPLFDGGSDYYGAKGAAATWASKTTEKKNIARSVIEKLEEALAGAEEAMARYLVDQSFAKASIARAEIARNKYNNGLLSFEDWDVIENDQISRQKAVLSSKKERVVAQAVWERAQGLGVWK